MKFRSIELFAGCGGLALGMEKAGFEPILLNEFDKNACLTLKKNRPNWNVIEGDIKLLKFNDFNVDVDLLTGGFPCQAFSHVGKRLGFEDTRGTLFYEFARAVRESRPKCFLAENVKGLLTHNSGKTIKTIIDVFNELGYNIQEPMLLNSVNYKTAQKRERVFIFGVRSDLKDKINIRPPQVMPPATLRDIFFKGEYYNEDVSKLSQEGILYSQKKLNLFKLIPEGGNWRSLTLELQKEYLGKMFNSGGGKTGILKRLSYDSPSVTILTSPSQKQTDRCHPLYDRPLTVRESARIQGFPDDWIFYGSISSKYKQIGNAVPVNLAYYLGLEIRKQLENI